jgi:transcriptional regulator with XRE-family HTH domain
MDTVTGNGTGTEIVLTFPERMLIVRRRLGWSQRDLGRAMGVTNFGICRRERYRRGSGQSDTGLVRKWRMLEVRYRREIEGHNQGHNQASGARAKVRSKGKR